MFSLCMHQFSLGTPDYLKTGPLINSFFNLHMGISECVSGCLFCASQLTGDLSQDEQTQTNTRINGYR